MSNEYELFQKTVLKLNVDDTSYIFTKPDSAEFKGKVLVVIQDAYADVKVFLHSEDDMKDYLTYDQYKQVIGFINRPVPTFKF